MRIYREHLTQVYTHGGNREGNCAREACGGPVTADQGSWEVCHNRSDGWVTNARLVHATCGGSMEFRLGRDEFVPAGHIVPLDER